MANAGTELPDDDGVRVVHTRAASRVPLALALAAAVLAGGWLLWRSPLSPVAAPATAARGVSEATPPAPARAAQTAAPTTSEPTMTPRPSPPPTAPGERPAEERAHDPNDVSNYFAPGDPEPTGAELIEALRAAGETEGIAAFNPPGTSPPLIGIAVPEDFELPPGYVRHHQVTDDGQPLEAILMFSPDHVFRDAAGNPVAIPEDRVVPPEMAPPGLPIRQIEIPPPQ